jgi:hypothetical protein
VAAVAVAAAAVGAGVTVGVTGAFASSASPSTPSASPPAAAAPGAGSGNGFLPPAAGGGSGGGAGAGEQMLAAGKVTAVNGTSITIAGNGNSVTAAITSATDFTGSAKSAGSIKVGDLVMIDISVNGSADTAASIQDPLAGGGSLP